MKSRSNPGRFALRWQNASVRRLSNAMVGQDEDRRIAAPGNGSFVREGQPQLYDAMRGRRRR